MSMDLFAIIKSIYVDGNADILRTACKSRIAFLDELCGIIRENCSGFSVDVPDDEPSAETNISVNELTVGNTHIKYTSILKISKLYDVYYLQHEFAIDNPDPDGLDSTFDGFKDEAYNKMQFKLDEAVSEYLTGKGYVRLYYNDIEESVFGYLGNPEDERLSQMTVGNAVFMDLWDIIGRMS